MQLKNVWEMPQACEKLFALDEQTKIELQISWGNHEKCLHRVEALAKEWEEGKEKQDMFTIAASWQALKIVSSMFRLLSEPLKERIFLLQEQCETVVRGKIEELLQPSTRNTSSKTMETITKTINMMESMKIDMQLKAEIKDTVKEFRMFERLWNTNIETGSFDDIAASVKKIKELAKCKHTWKPTDDVREKWVSKLQDWQPLHLQSTPQKWEDLEPDFLKYASFGLHLWMSTGGEPPESRTTVLNFNAISSKYVTFLTTYTNLLSSEHMKEDEISHCLKCLDIVDNVTGVYLTLCAPGEINSRLVKASEDLFDIWSKQQEALKKDNVAHKQASPKKEEPAHGPPAAIYESPAKGEASQGEGRVQKERELGALLEQLLQTIPPDGDGNAVIKASIKKLQEEWDSLDEGSREKEWVTEQQRACALYIRYIQEQSDATKTIASSLADFFTSGKKGKKKRKEIIKNAFSQLLQEDLVFDHKKAICQNMLKRIAQIAKEDKLLVSQGWPKTAEKAIEMCIENARSDDISIKQPIIRKYKTKESTFVDLLKQAVNKYTAETTDKQAKWNKMYNLAKMMSNLVLHEPLFDYGEITGIILQTIRDCFAVATLEDIPIIQEIAAMAECTVKGTVGWKEIDSAMKMEMDLQTCMGPDFWTSPAQALRQIQAQRQIHWDDITRISSGITRGLRQSVTDKTNEWKQLVQSTAADQAETDKELRNVYEKLREINASNLNELVSCGEELFKKISEANKGKEESKQTGIEKLATLTLSIKTMQAAKALFPKVMVSSYLEKLEGASKMLENRDGLQKLIKIINEKKWFSDQASWEIARREADVKVWSPNRYHGYGLNANISDVVATGEEESGAAGYLL